MRDELWKRAVKECKGNGVTQVWSASNAQGFRCRQFGESSRKFLDFEGLDLVTIPREEEGKEKKPID